MDSHWEETLKVRAYDVDSSNRLKISSFFNYMQDIAAAHADNLNVGWKALQKEGLFWVLSWMKIEFEKFPKFEDNITIKTWPKGKHKLYALRDFILYNEKKVKSLTMNFVTETKFGDKLEINKIIKDEHQHYFEAVNQQNGKIVFQAIVEWNAV